MSVFKGWVPTITGKLSFSQIGNFSTKTGKRCSATYKNSAGCKEFIAWQKRMSKDTPSLSRLINLASSTKKMVFFLEAKESPGFVPISNSIDLSEPKFVHDSKAMLKGSVLVHGRPGWFSGNQEVSRFKSKVKSIKIGRNIKIQNVASATLGTIAKTFTEKDLWAKAEFELLRSGECKIHIVDYYPKIKNANASSAAEIQNVLADQIFFFLRDLTHKHYHHSDEADQTTVTYPSDDDDYLWRRETLYSLSRIAMQARRKNDHTDCKTALGLIAYAKAFQRHLGNWCAVGGGATSTVVEPALLNGGIPEFVPYDFTSMQSSLESTIRHLEWQNSLKFQTIAYLTAAFGIGTAVLFSTLNLIPPPASDVSAGASLPSSTVWVVGVVSKFHHFIFLGLLGSCLSMYFIIFDRKKRLDGMRRILKAISGSLYPHIKFSRPAWFVVVGISFLISALLLMIGTLVIV